MRHEPEECMDPFQNQSKLIFTQVYKSFDYNDYLSFILCVEKCVSDSKLE